MEKMILSQLIIEQKKIFEKDIQIVKRDIAENIISSPKIIVITGVRRSGKSTLLRQLSKHYKNFSYINFEDERLLEFTYHDFNSLLEIFLILNPKSKTFFFDEIQVISGWEKFVRRLFTEGYKIFVTGSNATLLSSEIATSLTGRNLRVELFPFSFKEYLCFSNFNVKKIFTTQEKAILSQHVKDYLRYGGFPEVVKSKDFEELNQIYQDIIIKDLLVRFKIRDQKDFRELSLFLLSNIGKKISFNNLKKLLEFSNTSKVKNYVDFLCESYLFFTINKYDSSIKKQIVNDKKIYAIDTGLVNSTSFQFSENRGSILENAVFLELKRRYKEIFYFEEKKECDFVIKPGRNIIHAFQVADNLSDPSTRKREIEGLKAAMDRFNLCNGTIITLDTEETIKEDNKKIYFIPYWKWLLE
ncbi:MAG: ATP-binding protein [Candidatus Thermoplasmatota archaeon]|nr:ATP-binding protein [Candidatus Thermoplasmatota archaeon]